MAEDQTIELSSPACYATEAHYGEIPAADDKMTDLKDLKIAIIGAGTRTRSPPLSSHQSS